MATDSTFDFLMPDVGEGLEEAEIVNWKVSVGQKIEVNQPMVEIESAKSLVELPSPYAGTVLEFLAKEGEIVRVGTAIIRLQISQSVQPGTKTESGRTEFLVGSISKGDESRRQRRTPRNFGGNVGIAEPTNVIETPAPTASKPTAGLASPPVRKLARDLGVDISSLVGSGPDGAITREDVMALSDKDKTKSTPTEPMSDSRETRTPIRGVRRAMAEAMVSSAFTSPHVTEWVTFDITASMQLLEKLRNQPDFAGIKLSPLPLLARAMCIAAAKTPEVNSFWNESTQEIVTKHYVNLGIATATERGLLVPNVKNADQLTLKGLTVAIADVVQAARTGKTEPAQMMGGTMSITNIGVFGIDAGTPILPPGQSSIISLGNVVQRPWVIDGEIAVRSVTTLALSFDHRLIDGAQGSTFLSDIAKMLHDPSQLIATI